MKMQIAPNIITPEAADCVLGRTNKQVPYSPGADQLSVNIKVFSRGVSLKLCKSILALFVLVALAQIGYSSNVGVTGAQFLKIGTGARPMGMGGAFGAIADDGYAAYWNPAGFANLKSGELVSTYLKYFEGIDYGYMGYAAPYGNLGVFGVGVSYLGVGGIEGRTGDTLAPNRKFTASDMCVTISYANRTLLSDIMPGLDLGINAKFIKQNIDDKNAQTGALDIGTLYHTSLEPLTIAVCLQNIGPGQKFNKERDPLPLNLKLSGAYRMLDNELTIASEIDQYIIDQKMYASLGCEYWILKMIGLRAGYKFGYHTDSLGSNTGLAAGTSFRALNFQLDYAFLPFGELGDTHRFSFSVKFE